MFAVTGITAKLANLTAFSEKHGKDNVSGLALKFEMTQPRSILNTLHDNLQGTFFKLTDPDLALAFPEIESFAWARELIGAKVIIGYEDLFTSAPVELAGTEVGNIVLLPQTGGSVGVTLRVKCKPDALSVGRLYEWLQKDVLLTIEPPLASATTEDDDDDSDRHSGRLALDGTR